MGTYVKKSRRGNVVDSIYLKSEYVSDPVSLLCAEIVIHAIADWRELCKRRAWLDEAPNARCNFAELRIFFKSDWCAFIMQSFDVEPAVILEVLEKELQEAMQSNRKKKGKKRYERF